MRTSSLASICLLIVLSHYGVTAYCKVYCVLGESGAGKTTLIIWAFGVPNLRTGNIYAVTQQVERHVAGPKALPFLAGSVVFDTQGLRDTNGTTDREILRQLSDYYLSERRAHGTDTIDGFLVLVSAALPRIWIHETLGTYLAAFSPELLRSIVIVVTQNNLLTQPKGAEFIAYISTQVQSIVTSKLGSGVRVPVVLFNALAPTATEKDDLERALSAVQPYELTHLDEPRRAIETIYQQMLNDTDNYKNVTVSTVETHNKTVKREMLRRVPRLVEVTKVEGCKWSVSLGPFSYCKPKKLTVQEYVHEDVPYEVEEQQEVPVVVETQQQQLRNEEAYYWQKALEEYELSMSPFASKSTA